MLTKLQLAVALCLALLVLAGCGGGDGGGSTPTSSSLAMTVNWPERSRDVAAPSSALSFKLVVQGSDLVLIGNRGANAAAHAETYTTPTVQKEGSFPFSLSFYAQADAQGQVVAVASGTVDLNGSTQLPQVQLSGTVKTVDVPSTLALTVGEQKFLYAEARDADGHIVGVSPDSFVWSVVSGASNVSNDGSMFTGVGLGEASVRATIDGIQSDPIAVSVFAGNIAILHYETQNIRWVGFQDGDGPWQQVSVSGAPTFTSEVSAPSGRYSWAVLFNESAQRVNLAIYHCTLAEQREITGSNSSSSAASWHTVAITVAGLQAGEEAMLFTRSPEQLASSNGTFSLSVENEGVAYALLRNVGGNPKRMVIARNVGIAATSLTLDLRGEGSFAIEPITVQAPSTFSIYQTLGEGNAIQPYESPSTVNGNSVTVFPIPERELMPNEYTAYSAGESRPEDKAERLIGGWRHGFDPGRTYAYGPWYTEKQGTRVAGGQVRVQIPDAGDATWYRYVPFGNTHRTDIRMSQGWHGSGTLTYTTPELRGAPGYPETTDPFYEIVVVAGVGWSPEGINDLDPGKFKPGDERDYVISRPKPNMKIRQG